MIVVAVVAILAMVAYPAYVESVRKSRRADAITLLNQISQQQERWRANMPSYTTDLSAAGLNVADPSSGFYVAAVPAATASSYTISATAAGAQLSDTNCAVLRLVVTGGNLENWAGSSVATLASAASNLTAPANVNARKCWNR